MTENQGRNSPNRRRETEMCRIEAISVEMSSAVRLLGGDGPAKEQNNRAARAARLPVTVIERLRWRKLKRVPADIADAIRAAVEHHNKEGLARAQHELAVAQARNSALMAYLEASNPDFYGAEIDRLGRPLSGDRGAADLSRGE